MKNNQKIAIIGLSAWFVLFAAPFARANGIQDSAIADRQTLINDTTDFLATVGKSDAEKKSIIRKRRQLRRSIRLEEIRKKRDAKTKKRMKQQQKIIMEKIEAKNNK